MSSAGLTKDTHFFVGTILAHPKSWVVIGVFWPKIQHDEETSNAQMNLFDEE